MADDAFEATWQQINAEVLAEMTAWRRVAAALDGGALVGVDAAVRSRGRRG